MGVGVGEAAVDLHRLLSGLTEGPRRLFRRLGLHPCQEIDVSAAAALDGWTLVEARRGLEEARALEGIGRCLVRTAGAAADAADLRRALAI